MNAKLDKISELSNILCEKDSLGRKIVAVGREFSLGRLMPLPTLFERYDTTYLNKMLIQKRSTPQ